MTDGTEKASCWSPGGTSSAGSLSGGGFPRAVLRRIQEVKASGSVRSKVLVSWLAMTLRFSKEAEH